MISPCRRRSRKKTSMNRLVHACWCTTQKRFELPTDGLEGRCSIQLSYWVLLCKALERLKEIAPSLQA
jgi:hypothetical protein